MQPADIREITVPGTTVSIRMVLCPGDDGAGIGPLWVLETEVPWELYDIFVYALDEPASDRDSDADAVSRPSKPYVPPDRGFGHAGYPAMGMTRRAAIGFCEWLSACIDETVRLPTASEWTHLARAGGIPTAQEASAWTAENSDRSTHPVAQKLPNAFGLFDTLGNVAEWVEDDSRRPVAMGGSYLDPRDACTPTARQTQERSWNASDPQIPKSEWWLADCSWVGFRFVIDAELRSDEE